MPRECTTGGTHDAAPKNTGYRTDPFGLVLPFQLRGQRQFKSTRFRNRGPGLRVRSSTRSSNADNVASAFSKTELTDILLYHVLTTEVSSYKALTLLGNVTMGNGATAVLKSFEGEIYVNDDAKVIIPDVVASNGVIHAVDTVILP